MEKCWDVKKVYCPFFLYSGSHRNINEREKMKKLSFASQSCFLFLLSLVINNTGTTSIIRRKSPFNVQAFLKPYSSTWNMPFVHKINNVEIYAILVFVSSEDVPKFGLGWIKCVILLLTFLLHCIGKWIWEERLKVRSPWCQII